MAGLIIPNTEEANKGKGDPTKATADAVNDALFVNVVGVAGDEIEEDDDNVHVFEVDFADIDVRPSFAVAALHAYKPLRRP